MRISRSRSERERWRNSFRRQRKRGGSDRRCGRTQIVRGRLGRSISFRSADDLTPPCCTVCWWRRRGCYATISSFFSYDHSTLTTRSADCHVCFGSCLRMCAACCVGAIADAHTAVTYESPFYIRSYAIEARPGNNDLCLSVCERPAATFLVNQLEDVRTLSADSSIALAYYRVPSLGEVFKLNHPELKTEESCLAFGRGTWFEGKRPWTGKPGEDQVRDAFKKLFRNSKSSDFWARLTVTHASDESLHILFFEGDYIPRSTFLHVPAAHPRFVSAHFALCLLHSAFDHHPGTEWRSCQTAGQ